MALIDLTTAKRELRVTHDAENADITRKVAAAREQAEMFLNRRVYQDRDELEEAIAEVAFCLAEATTAYDLAVQAAWLVEAPPERRAAERFAAERYREAQDAAQMVYRGMLANDSVRTAILLITASLYEHRGDEDAVAGLPKAAREILGPFRVGLGV